MIELLANSVDDTRAIAAATARCARIGDLIVLAGEMGVGKTAFAQGFGRELGILEPITSPTYTLVHSYQSTRMHFHHADVYRLENTTEVVDLAFDELLEDGLVLVEWGDVVDLGPQLRVELRHLEQDEQGCADDTRELTITASGRGWATRWERLEAELERWSA